MATRFYLPSTGAAAVSPAFTGWTQTTGADRIKCVTTKISSAMTTKTQLSADAISNDLLRQYVSDPIVAGDITGTVKGIIRAAEAGTLQDLCPQIRIRVCSNDGSTFRGTLIDFNNGALSNEFVVTTLTNRKYPRGWSGAGTSVSTVTAQTDDRIVIEVGWREAVAGEGANGNLRFGDAAGADLAEDETGTTDNNPWIEFSADLFAGGGGGPTPPAAVVTIR
jgi:hypothetical protein